MPTIFTFDLCFLSDERAAERGFSEVGRFVLFGCHPGCVLCLWKVPVFLIPAETSSIEMVLVDEKKATGAVAKTLELSSSGMEIEIAELVYGLMTSKKEKIQKKIKNKVHK
ncbi:hypothetical protein P8452_09053 [Trifolium repens]|nr:hypothetical protein P8452_09053 [Trifolium repens]